MAIGISPRILRVVGSSQLAEFFCEGKRDGIYGGKQTLIGIERRAWDEEEAQFPLVVTALDLLNSPEVF